MFGTRSLEASTPASRGRTLISTLRLQHSGTRGSSNLRHYDGQRIIVAEKTDAMIFQELRQQYRSEPGHLQYGTCPKATKVGTNGKTSILAIPSDEVQ